MPVINLNWRRVNRRNACVGILLATLFFNEYLVYSIQSWRWLEFPKSSDRKHDVVMLLVGDPQLQGYINEPPSVIGSLSRWDADRYLRNNFQLAMGYVKPDVIVFLGDLLDEGSIATDSDYLDYKQRFDSIFATSTEVQKIFLPGDNDVGGEGGDLRTQPKVDRFTKHFQEVSGVTHVSFVDFVKMDIQFHSQLTKDKQKVATHISSRLAAPYRVLLNHMSVLTKLKVHVHPILTKIRPQLIISAHWHKSNHFVCADCMSHQSDVELEYWPVHRRDLTNEDSIVTVDLHDVKALNELMVPSCSYRMGEVNIGYGVVLINDSGVAHYGVLWLPQRYQLLYGYIFVLCTLPVLFLLSKLADRSLKR